MSVPSFIIVPLLCFFSSAFLFLVVVASKKNRLIVAFIHLLFCFVLWTGGSVLMRLSVYPGMEFWYGVSATGIFCVPFCIYNFLYFYTNRRGSFARTMWFLIWLVIVVLNWFNVFITNQRIELINGVREFHYDITPLAVIPIVVAAATLFCACRMVWNNIRQDGVAPGSFTPLLIGVLVMFLGLIVQSVFHLVWLNTDTIFCGVNAVCLYYALYKKRIITLSSMAASRPISLMAVAFGTITGVIVFPYAERLYDRFFGNYPNAQVFVYCLFFSVITILYFTVLRALAGKLFVKNQEARERELAKLGRTISASLEIDTTVETFREFLLQNCVMERAYILLADENKENYRIAACTQDIVLKNFSITAEHPLAVWLRSHAESISYQAFCRTKEYRSMWAQERRALEELRVDFALPITSDGALLGMVLFSAKKGHVFSPAEVSFLESAAALVAIAFKNASLYVEMQNEARRDPLTELYNHRYFLKKLKADFDECAEDRLTLLMISLDDFRLYNELYGTQDGDLALQRFSRIIESIVGERGTVSRFAGKEFAVSLPHLDAVAAKGIARECRALLEREMSGAGYPAIRRLTFSAGICSYPFSASNMDDLLSYANMAVYSAKRSGKNTTVVYSPDKDKEITDAASGQARELDAARASTIYALTAAIDAKDNYTFRHSDNVAHYAAALAKEIPLDADHVEIIRQAGLLHDIGKIGVPEAILTKQGRLTAEEYEMMKQHVEGSIAMIRHLPSLDYLIPAVIGHHERWDGKGYPRGLAGEAIPVGARCLCIADTFDAMTSNRPYRRALTVETALAEIERNLGLQFDPQLGRLFINLVRSGRIQIGEEGENKQPAQLKEKQ